MPDDLPSLTTNNSTISIIIEDLARRPSDDWSADNAAGRQIADRIVQSVRDQENPIMLGHVVKSIVERGRWSGVEVGFFHRLSDHLITSATEAVE